ncbi:MAG: Ig-like domain-containing protein, partial [Candidatus Poribacteria bacterium]|nr:Ig-like domain-containing protein [Candidatus Poribacteria bacterium]
DNVDDVGPLGPTNVVATSIDAVDSVFMDNGDGTYTVGGLVDKYDGKSPVVTFTISPTADPKTYAGVALMTSLPEGAIVKDADGELIVRAEDTGAYDLKGSGPITVTVDVGTLMDDDELVHNDVYLQSRTGIYKDYDVYTFTVSALAYDEVMNPQTHDRAESGEIIDTVENKITVNVMNSYRPDPGVLAITVVNSDGMTNPDSGAPQGELTFNAYTHGLTSPPTEGVRFEVKRPGDTTWERITGTVEPPVMVEGSDLAGIVGGLVGITEAGTVSGELTELEIPAAYQKWSVVVDTRELALEDTVVPDDTIKLDDTIERGDASQRDVSKDANQYEVRAIALTPKNLDHPEYDDREGVEASFSLDNVDDVPPLGPTNITDVADVAGSIAANEDGSYTVGGIVDPGVESPVATFSIEPTADMKTYVGGKIGLVQTAADGSETMAEASLEDGKITVDVGLLANGTYMYHALVADAFGNWQVQGEEDMPSPVITVHVLNFRVSDITGLTVTAVDGESPDRLPLQMTVGELAGRFPLKESISVSFNVNNGSLAVGDLTGVLVDGHEVMFTAGSDAENAFSLMASGLMAVADGWYTPEGRVTKRNGSVTFQLATINLDNTGPMITIVSPTEGEAVNGLPSLNAGFGDGDMGSGVSDGSGVSMMDTAAVSLDRLRPEEVVQDAVPIDVDQSMVEQDLDSVVYTRIDKLAGGAYQFTIKVSDKLGNVGEQSVAFAVEGENPTVVITAPAAGQTFDHSPEKVTGFFAGGGEVSISKFTINDADMTAEVMENNFSYMPADALGDGDYTVAVEVTDGSGLTAQTALTFTVELPVPTASIDTPTAGQVYDHGMPIITGEFSGADPVTGTLSIDDKVVMKVSGNEFTYTPTDALSDGPHTVTVNVTDKNGRTAQASTMFTVDIPGPTVAINSPAAGQTYDHGKPAIRGEFSGVAAPVSLSLTLNGEAVEAVVSDGEFMYTPADLLVDGEYTVVAQVMDANGKSAEATAIFTVRLPVPTVAIHTPANGQMYDHSKPSITREFSGLDPVELTLTINGEAVEAVVSDGEFSYTPAEALGDGEYTVVAGVSDANGKSAEATVVFSVRLPVPTATIVTPAAGQSYDHGMPIIHGNFSGAAPVEVSLSIDGEAVEAMVNENNEFTYTPAEALSDGEHMVAVEVTDANGRTAQTSTTFMVDIPGPTVAINSPAAGQMYDISKPVVTGEFSGVAAPVSLSLTINGEAVEAVVSDGGFSYTPAEALDDGEYTVVAQATDANGKSAEATVVFSIRLPVPTATIVTPAAGQVYDHGMPIIQGNFSGAAPVEVSLSIDGEAVEAMVNENNEFTYTPAEALSDGEHMVAVEVTDANGRTAQTSTDFMVDIPGPTVAINSPAAGQMYDHDMPVVRGEFTGVGDVTVALTVNGKEAEAKVEGNGFTYTPAEGLGEGEHTVAVEVTDANGKMAQATAIFTVEFPMASVMLHAPAAGHTYNHGKPAITGEFTGVGDVAVKLTVDGKDAKAEVSGNQFSHKLANALGHGEHTVAVEVTDANGETAQTSAVFTVDIPGPTVMILSPASGQTYDHGGPVIRGEFSGMTDVEVTTFTVNGEDVEPEINEDNQFTYTPDPVLGNGEHTVFVEVTDANDKTAQASVVFNVKLDSTPPVISEVSPSGLVTLNKQDTLDENFAITIAAVITEAESAITSVKYIIDGQLPANSYPVERAGSKFEVTESFTPGTHSIKLMVTSEGGTREFSWQFTLEVDKSAPVISSITPTGTIHAGLPVVSVSATDDSGVEEMAIVVMDSNGKEVKGDTSDDDEDRTNAGITRLDFRPEAPLSEGTYTIEVRATDAFGNSSTGSSIFTVDFDTAAPIITASSPQDGARLMYKHDEQARPTISITFADAETGVNVDSIKLVIEAPKWGGGTLVTPINLTDKQKSATQVIYKPAAPVFTDRLAPGEHVVKLEVSDNAHQQGNVSEKSDGAREANTAVYQFSFFVEYTDAPILMKPFNFPNPFKDNTRISFGLNRMSTVSIVVYDATLRPVRVLRDNVVMNAGDYTGNNGIGWDGKTSGGEDLARGIYFCVIEVTDGFEPESAILKLALTR